MATVKGILVNDGGAPSRIINFKAGEDISAGEALAVSAADTVKLCGQSLGGTAPSSDGTMPIAGFALTDASSGDMVSVVTGSGIVVYAMCKSCVAGDALSVGATAGTLDDSTADTVEHCAIALEANTVNAGALTKVLVV